MPRAGAASTGRHPFDGPGAMGDVVHKPERAEDFGAIVDDDGEDSQPCRHERPSALTALLAKGGHGVSLGGLEIAANDQ